MNIAMLTQFFMWGVILNAVFLIVSTFFGMFAADWVYSMHRRFFDISRDAFNVVFYSFLGVYKILVLVFFVVPYVSLLIIG